ncbi:MAG: ATP-binding cassette domain-containing protein [Candidatus Caenarcaniphilales bacterium]|nr:ATP-binding cassette domain-containing protein [Candidatus Caenarcaniphilales bacterium]
MIELYRVNKDYANGQSALKDISLHIPMGQMTFLIGESGAGKSTLLKILYRAETFSSGRVLVGRVDISRLTDFSQLRKRIGLIFQDYILLPHLNVFDNVAYILRAQGASEREVRYRVEGALNVVGLLDKEKEMTQHLSGGERQRVGIARAIVTNPPILLADEPTGNLDPVNSLKIFQLFKEINEKLKMTMIIATHDPRVNQLRKRIVQLSGGMVTMDTDPSTLPMFGSLVV